MSETALDPHVERLLSGFNDHDVDRYMRQYADGATFRDPFVGEITKPELRDYVRESYGAFPDFRIELDRVLSARDPTALEITFVGTHEGPFYGIPPTGERGELPAVVVMDVAEDGITVRRDYWDRRGFREELGLTFPAVLGRLPSVAWRALRDRLGRTP
ncbi:MAG: ester cyclase [Halobacteriales archaeon]